MNQDLSLLQKIVEGARSGADACSQLADRCEDDAMCRELRTQRDDYESAARDAEALLEKQGVRPRPKGAMARAGMWFGMQVNTMMDRSASHIADICIQGATMGVIALTRDRNDLPDASPEAQDMAANLITAQQDAIERLKKHLVSEPEKEKQKT